MIALEGRCPLESCHHVGFGIDPTRGQRLLGVSAESDSIQLEQELQDSWTLSVLLPAVIPALDSVLQDEQHADGHCLHFWAPHF